MLLQKLHICKDFFIRTEFKKWTLLINAQLVANMALILVLPVIETMMEKSGNCYQTIKVDCTEIMEKFQASLYNEFTKD